MSAQRFIKGLLGLLLASAFITQIAAASTRAVVIAGLGGNPESTAAFTEQSTTVANALETLATSPDHVTLLQGADSNRDALLDALKTVSDEVAANVGTDDAIDNFVLIILGHGNTNRDGWQFNVAGPDFSASDLVAGLAPMNVANEVVVVSTSASGALLKSLAQPGRTLITATKSGGELNAVRFTEYFAAALASSEADVDRNELLTVKEAFAFANDSTVQYFEDQKLLASEHANFAGEDAANVTLATLGALRDAQNNPAIATLLDERLVLEKQFYEVKASKESLALDDYYKRLEAVLVDIATLQRTIDTVVGGGDSIE